MNMSSYNNIEKIKYASPDCVVTLQEYIVFENERAEEKYVVFKFSNNVSQQLLGMEFEVSQYDIDGNLVEKSVVIYNKFLSKPNASFVPNAKLKVNFAFKPCPCVLFKPLSTGSCGRRARISITAISSSTTPLTEIRKNPAPRSHPPKSPQPSHPKRQKGKCRLRLKT